MDIAKRIATIPLFEGLPQEQLEDLAGIVEEPMFRKGQTIFSEGDEGAGFYVVASGRVKVFKLSSEGKEQILHILGPGEPFGEVPVFAGQHFPANAEAMDDSRLYFFPRGSFVRLIRKNPGLALNMLAVLSRRLRVFASLIEDLSLKEVPGRLAAYLLYLSRKDRGSERPGTHRHQGTARKPPRHHSRDPLPHPRKDERAGADRDRRPEDQAPGP